MAKSRNTNIVRKRIKMANEQNLKPFTSEQSREEAAKNGAKGGKASGEARRKKRDLKLAIQALLESDVKDKKTGDVMSGAEALAVAQFRKAMRGDTKAFEVLRDTSGQSIVQKVAVAEVDNDIIKEIEDIVSETE